MIYKKIAKRVDPKSSHHNFFLFYLSYLYKMMDVNLSYYGNQSMMYVSQMSMLYTLNLYSDVCQLFLNKTGGKIK